MQGKVVIEGEYMPDYDEDANTFVIDTVNGPYHFNKRYHQVELEINYAAGTVILADDGQLWVVAVGRSYSVPDDGGDSKFYSVHRLNTMDVGPGISSSLPRSKFAELYPKHRVVFSPTSEQTK